MHPGVLSALLAFSASAGMAVYVALRRDKTDFHWLLLALLAALLLWTGGLAVRFNVTTAAGLRGALQLVYAGIFATPPIWLALAARHARAHLFLSRGALVALAAPSAISYLALATNDGHRLFMREVSFETLAQGPDAWAGPVYWVFLAWAYLCVGGGALLYLRSAHRMVTNDDRWRGWLLAAAAMIPLLCSLVYVFQIVPVPFDLTPAGLTITVAILCAAVFRYKMLESLPLARRDVIELLREGVVMANASGVVLDLNPAAERILGRASSNVRGRPIDAVLTDRAIDSDATALRRALAGLGADAVIHEVRTRDGAVIEVTMALARDREGDPAGQFAVLRDRTEERRSERTIRQTQRMDTISTLASGIAHEVNNPLAFIRANLAQIHRVGQQLDACADDPEAKLAVDIGDLTEIVEETLDGIGRIERIVSGMRRLTASGNDPFVSVNMNDVLADAVRLANLRNEEHIEVRMQLARRLPRLDGSPQRLVQAFLNIVVNSRQALEGRPRGVVEIETRREDGGVVVEVADDGPGVSEELRDRIFDPFFTTKDPDQGTGLGLAITVDILRDHGGVLEMHSAPGEGATFIARFPARG